MGSGSSVSNSAHRPILPWRRNRAGTAAEAEAEGVPAIGEAENVVVDTQQPSNIPASPNVPILEVVIPTPLPCRPNANSLLLISPRQEAALISSVPYTPTTSIGAHTFKYYCPLCMEYFEGIFKSKCCGNYTCLGCTKDFLAAKGFEADSASIILANIPTYKDHVPCPHCFTNGFHPIVVNTEDEIRDYKGTNNKLTISPRNTTTSSSSIDGIAYGGRQSHTPLKIGDSFEDLKRKMIPFAVNNQRTMTNNDQQYHDKENLKQYENSPGIRISPRVPSPYNIASSSSTLPMTVAYSSSSNNGNGNGNVSQGIAMLMCSPDADEVSSSQQHNVLRMGASAPDTNGSVQTSSINALSGPGTNNSTASNGRRTIRLGLAQSTTTSVPTSSSSPSPFLPNHSSSASPSASPSSARANGNTSYLNNHLVGRNLFDDVSAEELRRDRDDNRSQRMTGTEVGVDAQPQHPQTAPQHPQLSHPPPSQQSSLGSALVVNINHHIDTGLNDLPPLGHATTRPPINHHHAQTALSHMYHHITPRSRMQLTHAASLMVEEIIGNAVEREQRAQSLLLGDDNTMNLHWEQREHLERVAPLC